jgi:quercetin dioxygenase-like cupin family protein
MSYDNLHDEILQIIPSFVKECFRRYYKISCKSESLAVYLKVWIILKGIEMKVIHTDDVEKTVPAMEGAVGITKQVPISGADGSPLFSFRVFTIEPKGHTPYHTHPFEHLNFVIGGEGVIVREDGTETPVHRGHFALILPDEKHQYKNTSDSEDMVMICAVPKEYE